MAAAIVRTQDLHPNLEVLLDGLLEDIEPEELDRSARFITSLLELPEDEVQRRVLARRLCTGCGLDYNLMAHRPDVEDACDVCGGQLVARPDDNPEALRRRLEDYYEKTRPVLEIFGRKEFVLSVDATPSVDDVFAEICSRVERRVRTTSERVG